MSLIIGIPKKGVPSLGNPHINPTSPLKGPVSDYLHLNRAWLVRHGPAENPGADCDSTGAARLRGFRV